MRWSLASFGLVAMLAASTPARAETLTGMLGAVQCGERCLLMIVDESGKTSWGECVASICQRWRRDPEGPGAFVGKTVKVKTYPGHGINEAGETDPKLLIFNDIFLPPP